MKRYMFMLFCALISTTVLFAQESLVDKYADRKGVATVYISPKMFSLMKDASPTGDVHLDKVIHKLTGLQILTCEDKAVAADIRKELPNNWSHNGYEVLMRVKEENEHIIICVKEGKEQNEYVLWVDSPDEVTLIVMNGTLTLEELQQVINQ